MQAQDIMTETPTCCMPYDTVRMAAKMMRESNCGMLPVVDNLENMQLVGVVTDRDIVCRVLAKDEMDCATTPVNAAMSSGTLWTVLPDASVDEVIEKMEEGQVRRIPVVDAGGKVLGVIATADIALEIDEIEDIAEVFEEISEPTHLSMDK